MDKVDRIKTTIITLLVVLIFGIPIYLGQSQKRILVIHSSNSDSGWVARINQGIDLYIRNNGNLTSQIVINYYYMDMERPDRQICEKYLTEMRNIEKTIQDQQPDVVIITDDIAQRLIGIRLAQVRSNQNDYLRQNAGWLIGSGNCKDNKTVRNKLIAAMSPLLLDKQPAIVFAGIDDHSAKEYGYDQSNNLDGIYKHQNLDAVKEALQDLYRAIPESSGKPAQVIVLSDSTSITSEDSRRISDSFSAPFNVPLKWGGFKTASNWDEWKRIVLQANDKEQMIYIAGYDDLLKDQPEEKLVKWTETCAKYPALGSSESFIGAGGMLSITTSGLEQGEVAMELAQVRLAAGHNAKLRSNDFREPHQFTVGMNQALFERRGLQGFPLIYESYSQQNNNFRNPKYVDYSENCK